MPTCFVIQPFDKGKFDKRYDDIYEKAIRAAGFDPYRVDRDHGVSVPIDSIESGIRTAAVCFADISEDNPNVWYELGFAFAARRPVVMACSDARAGSKFPFDIQHRAIVVYKTESTSDFTMLSENLTSKIKAVSEREDQLSELSEATLITPVSGMSQPELMVLAVLASSLSSPDATLSQWAAKRDAESAGVTGMGFNLALRRLQTKGFIETGLEENPHHDEPTAVLSLLNRAWDWIDVNESKFVLHQPPAKEQVRPGKRLSY
jgi:hypothetical protein